MTLTPCSKARDTITTGQGHAVNTFEIDDQTATGESPWEVTSHCRTDDGTWVTWIAKGLGNEIGDGSNPADWAVSIANASFVQAAFFPDDGSPPSVFDLPIEPCFTWNGAGRYSRMGDDGKKCAIRSVLPGIYFAPNVESELQGWFSGAIDAQVRSDGVNVWVAILAQESTMYPWLSTVERVDKCGIPHSSILSDASGEGLAPGSDGTPFTHDTTGSPSDTWWQQSNVTPGDQDDAGVENSFRWQPARITVYGGGLGGFNKLDTLEASFGNCYEYGLIGHLEAAASPAEPGVLHVLWAEGGYTRAFEPTISWDGESGKAAQRINYSRWDASGKILDTDIAFTSDGTTRGSGRGASSFPAEWVWTDEYILRNDHGSPAAFIWNWNTDSSADVTRADGPTTLNPQVGYWDLSSGSPVTLQVLDLGLVPTAAEAGFVPVIPVGTVNTVGAPSARSDDLGFPGRSHFASSLYTDPTLADTDIYIVGVNYGPTGAAARLSAFYRIPADGSDTFTILDGIRNVGYSIIAGGTLPRVAFSDFVSDTRNIWIPAPSADGGGGGVWHLTRTCEKTWELLQAFPASTLPDPGVDLAGTWAEFGSGSATLSSVVLALTSPPSIVTDDSGRDWLTAGGAVPAGQFSGNFPFYGAALRARICRCCVPCGGHGIHLWRLDI